MNSKGILICGLMAALAALPACTGVALLDRYAAGVRDAAVAEPSELVDDLVRIARDNASLVWNEDKSRLLVVTWKRNDDFEKYFKGHLTTSADEDHLVWVTVAPKLQERCRAFAAAHPDAGAAGLNLYLKQFLGLYPKWTYDLFVELWVPPESLFRPCVDPETDDGSCELKFGAANPTVAGIRDYKAFYDALYLKSFRYPPGVPWTGLGYTYNWGEGPEQGASEFILSPGTPYTVHRAVPTAAYCAP